MYAIGHQASARTRRIVPSILASAAAVLPACLAKSDTPGEFIGQSQAAVTVDGTHWYYVVNGASQLCLDDQGGSVANNGPVDQASCAPSTNNQWQFTSVGSGDYQVVNRTSSFCLNNQGSTAAGAPINQWHNCAATSNNLRWTITDLGNGYVNLVSKTSGMCLDDPGASAATGTVQDQQTCSSGSTSMEWQLVDSAAAADAGAASGPLPWPAANQILSSIVVPTFPSKNCTVTDAAYGGKGDGKTDNTAAFKSAIADCAGAGGGHVVVPAGTFVSGAIELLDDIDLHLNAGATIAFSGDISKYPLVYTRTQGMELMNHSPAIYVYGRTNVGLTGSGTLDAAGTATFNSPSAISVCSTGWTTLQGWGDKMPTDPGFVPVTQRILPSGQAVRQSFVQFYQSHNILMQGVTLTNAQFWQTHVVLSSNVTIDGITENPPTASNTDCFDPESSDHVVIKNANLSCHDDCMAVKSGRDNDGRRVNVPTTNLVAMNVSCQTPYGLVTLGSEESAGMQNVYGYNLTTHGTGARNLIDMRSNAARGGGGTNIYIDTVPSATLSGPVVLLETAYNAGSCNTAVGNVTPIWDNVNLSNITISGAPQLLNLTGVASHPTNMTMHHSAFTSIGNATNAITNANVTFDQVTLNGTSL